MKKGDRWVLLVVLLAAAVLAIVFAVQKKAGAEAVVYVSGVETARFPLSTPIQWRLETAWGYNEIQIEDGGVSVIDADCRDGICVNHAPISSQGESIVCLPHEMVIEIEGETAAALDGVVQ